MFRRGDAEIRAFGPAQADSVILAGLTSTNLSQGRFLNQAAFSMSGSEDLMVDDFVPASSVVFIEKSNACGNGLGAVLVDRGAGAFNKDMIVIEGSIEKSKSSVESLGVAGGAEPDISSRHECPVTVDASMSGGLHAFPLSSGLRMQGGCRDGSKRATDGGDGR
jgi:hypothetical protein